MKKILALVLAMMMVLTMGAVAFAAATVDSGKGGDATITITLPTDNAGTDEEITYKIFKVFEATTNGTAISYKIDSANGPLTDAMTAAGFFLDDGGNVHYGTFTEDENGTYVVGGKKGTITDKTSLDQAALDAIAAYAKDEITGNFKAKPSDKTLAITGLQYGYYYITTTTGTVVTVDSTNKNADVQDKNTIPGPPDKSITGVGDGSLDEAGEKALAQVGTTVNFSVDIVKVKGATNYVFHDTMTAGLSYNGDVTVTTPANAVYDKTVKGTDTITLTFDNTWLAGLADDTKITITYSATVTSDALTVNAAKNTATLDYGDGHTTDKDEVEVYNAKFTVTKQDGDGKALEGAGFVIKNNAGKYYKFTAATEATDDAPATPAKVEWVDSIDDATEYKSDATGAVPAFTGLADGTYTLVEKTVPEGYNKAADSTFTIAKGNYEAANTEQTATVINESGATLPSTGGIGTTIFYIAGSILVLAAAVLLVTKRRMGNND